MLLVLQAIESSDEKEWLYKRVGSRYLWLSHCKLFRSDLIKNVPRLRNCRSLSQALCTASSHAINICFGKTLAALHWGGHWSLSMGPKGHIHNFLAGYFPPFFKYIFFKAGEFPSSYFCLFRFLNTDAFLTNLSFCLCTLVHTDKNETRGYHLL